MHPTCPSDPLPALLDYTLCSVMSEYLNSAKAAFAVRVPVGSVHRRHSEMSMAERKLRVNDTTPLLPSQPQWIGLYSPTI